MDLGDSPTTFRGTSIARARYMPNDFEQLLKDLFGEPLNRLTQFSSEQTQRIQTRVSVLCHMHPAVLPGYWLAGEPVWHRHSCLCFGKMHCLLLQPYGCKAR